MRRAIVQRRQLLHRTPARQIVGDERADIIARSRRKGSDARRHAEIAIGDGGISTVEILKDGARDIPPERIRLARQGDVEQRAVASDAVVLPLADVNGQPLRSERLVERRIVRRGRPEVAARRLGVIDVEQLMIEQQLDL